MLTISYTRFYMCQADTSNPTPPAALVKLAERQLVFLLPSRTHVLVTDAPFLTMFRADHLRGSNGWRVTYTPAEASA